MWGFGSCEVRMRVQEIKTSLFRAGQSLPELLKRHLPRLRERSIVVITSKIVALSEGRIVPCPTERARIRLIRQESRWAVKTKYTWLTLKDGMVMASAGIDQSNAFGQCILLPRDSYASAARLRQFLRATYQRKNLGVLLTDSRLMPLREGITGVAVGYAGFKGIREYRGKPDLFGRKLQMTRTNVADSLAAAAVLCLGEGKECQPLAVITDAPVVFTEHVNRRALLIDPREDMYLPFFQALHRKKIPFQQTSRRR